MYYPPAMHENSRLLFAKHARGLFSSRSRVLEIGPDGFPSTYRQMIGVATAAWDTLDIHQDQRLTFPGSDSYAFPIADGAYDIVLAGQVLEHVPKVWLWLRELERVCAPGGHVVLVSPVSWPYHEAPVDCWRVHPEGMRALLEGTGLAIEACVCESLETPGYRRYVPGKSLAHRPLSVRALSRVIGLFGYPVERAYDLVTIARRDGVTKPGS